MVENLNLQTLGVARFFPVNADNLNLDRHGVFKATIYSDFPIDNLWRS